MPQMNTHLHRPGLRTSMVALLAAALLSPGIAPAAATHLCAPPSTPSEFVDWAACEISSRIRVDLDAFVAPVNTVGPSPPIAWIDDVKLTFTTGHEATVESARTGSDPCAIWTGKPGVSNCVDNDLHGDVGLFAVEEEDALLCLWEASADIDVDHDGTRDFHVPGLVGTSQPPCPS